MPKNCKEKDIWIPAYCMQGFGVAIGGGGLYYIRSIFGDYNKVNGNDSFGLKETRKRIRRPAFKGRM